MNRITLWTSGLALVAAGALSAPVALGQVADLPCGTPPRPVPGVIPFTDITTQSGYHSVAAPTTDLYPDYFGGTGGECGQVECYDDSSNTFYTGPFAQTYNLGTVSLPFPFGFSGIYADGGNFVPPFQVSIWGNGLLTFDSSVSFNPTQFPISPPPPADCNLPSTVSNGSIKDTLPAFAVGAVTDIFGGFPFARQWGPPNALIAPWWGDLSVCPNMGQVGYLLTLDADNTPMLIVQWTDVTATKVETPAGPDTCNETSDFSSCLDDTLTPYAAGVLPTFSFQARLHSNNDVDFVYGAASNLNASGACFQQAVGNCGYVSGVQSNLSFTGPNAPPPLLDYATQALDCDSTTGCLQPQFPSGTSVTFHDVFRSVGPDLQVVGITPPGQVPQGGTVNVATSISNGGGGDSTGEGTLQFYFSAGSTTPVGNPFSAQSVPMYSACHTAPFQAQVTIPAQVPQGGGYLIAEFVPGAESVDQNHSFAYAPVVVGPAEADVAMVDTLSFSPAAIVGGQQISVTFEAQNVGEVDAPSVAYGVYLSLGGSISPSDLQIGGGVISDLPTGGAPQTIVNNYTIPNTVVSGEYIVGAILNPSGTLREVNQTNNVGVAPKLLALTSPGPVIVTTSLRDAQANSPYSVQLIGGGGDGKYQWSLNAGALPSGLTLTKSGLVAGQAQNAGTSQFEAKVTDGLNHTATATFQLTVDPFTQALTIVSSSLPAGSTDHLYNFPIGATGGVPPYQWALVPGSGSVPAGISLLSSGTLTGEPQFDGSTSFSVTVTDSIGTVVTSPSYTLTVYAAGTLAVGSTLLPPATIGVTYTTTLHHAGGTAPYVWTLLDVQREPDSPSDPLVDLQTNLPACAEPGCSLLGWYPSQGEISGKPSEVGVFALTVEVTDSEVPPATATGLVILTISSPVNFSFTTVQLPDATTNEPYTTQLLTTAADPSNVTCYAIDTAQHKTDKAAFTLPPGLTLLSQGCGIQGVALASGSYPFLVEAVDDQGGLATQSFTIQVSNPPVAKSGGGCQSASGAPAWAGLLLLALGGLKRRRRR